jgi:glycosyltransferase involved in cell wall biosynthesis
MPASPTSISVIVVCRNPGTRLHTALESIWSQTFRAEIIVVDGASTDGTREWLEARRDRITTLISEPDNGIYEAMNKGIAAVTSEWLLFLGADDFFASPSTLAEAANLLADPQAAVVVGEARFDDGRLYPFRGSRAAIRRNFVHHQASFYRRTLFERHGGFDTSLRIQADYEYNLRLLHAGAVFTSIPLRISECASGGLSDSGRWANYREEISARHRYFPGWRCWPWDLLAALRYARKNIVRSQAT